VVLILAEEFALNRCSNLKLCPGKAALGTPSPLEKGETVERTLIRRWSPFQPIAPQWGLTALAIEPSKKKWDTKPQKRYG
jgi:hypothetical protein